MEVASSFSYILKDWNSDDMHINILLINIRHLITMSKIYEFEPLGNSQYIRIRCNAFVDFAIISDRI